MGYTDYISRTEAAPLIPEDVVPGIMQGVTEQSTVLRLSRRLPNMPTNRTRMAVMEALPVAYFVTGDTGLKQTTKVDWQNKYLDAEEVAVIVPIPEAVLEDSEYDMWAQIRPLIVEAFGVLIDSAILLGYSAPASWPTAVTTAAAAAGNTVTKGAGADIYDDILGENGVVSLIEADGFMPTGYVAKVSLRGTFRGLRDSNGNPIFKRDIQTGATYILDGEPCYFPKTNFWTNSAANEILFAGDWSQLVYSFRQDMRFKLLSESVIQDGAGDIVYNLAQQDMVALRVTARLGWQLPNPVNRQQETELSRYPFARLVSA